MLSFDHSSQTPNLSLYSLNLPHTLTLTEQKGYENYRYSWTTFRSSFMSFDVFVNTLTNVASCCRRRPLLWVTSKQTQVIMLSIGAAAAVAADIAILALKNNVCARDANNISACVADWRSLYSVGFFAFALLWVVVFALLRIVLLLNRMNRTYQ